MKTKTETTRANYPKLVRIALSIISVVFIASFIVHNSHNIAITRPKWLFLCLLIPLFVNPLIANNRWKFFLKLNDIHESVFFLAKISFISSFYGLMLPSASGFDAIRIYLIEKRHPDKRGQGGSTVVLERLMGMLSLFIIATFSSIFMPSSYGQKSFKLTILTVSLAGIVLILSVFTQTFYLFVNKLLYSRITSQKKYIKSVVEYVSKLHQALHLAVSPGMMLKSFMLISLYQLSTIINVALVYKALGLDLPFTVHLLFMPVIYILSIIPITVSGLGVREGLFAFFYNSVGVSSVVSVMASLMNYVILSLVPAFIGFILTLLSPNAFDKETYVNKS